MYSATPNMMIGREQHGELLAEPIVGFRGLVYEKDGSGWLKSHKTGEKWYPTEDHTAECPIKGGDAILVRIIKPYHRKHDAPGEDCTCGLYGYFNPSSNDMLGNITVMIQCWGPTQFHSKGFRTKNQRIVALVIPKKHKERQDWIEFYNELAKLYKVAAIHEEHALVKGGEYGHVVTKQEIDEWEKGYLQGYKKVAIKEAILGLLTFLLWCYVLYSNITQSWAWNSTELIYLLAWFVVTILVYWYCPAYFARGLKTVLNYQTYVKTKEPFKK